MSSLPPRAIEVQSPTAMAYIRARIAVQPNGCWRWTPKARSDSGYGVACINYVQWRAHRLSYATFVGPIPDGLVLHHKCFNRECVNPEHLEPMTIEENVRLGSSEEWPRTPTLAEVAAAAPEGHGTTSAYGFGCRCPHCREARRVYARRLFESRGQSVRPARGPNGRRSA